MADLPDDVRSLFEGANFAHIATTNPDGAPNSVPIWIGMEGARIAFFTVEGSRKARNLERDPRLALSIVAVDNPYEMATVRGRLAEVIRGDEGLEIVDRISHKYTGAPFPYRTMTAYLVEPEKSSHTKLDFEHTPTV